MRTAAPAAIKLDRRYHPDTYYFCVRTYIHYYLLKKKKNPFRLSPLAIIYGHRADKRISKLVNNDGYQGGRGKKETKVKREQRAE